MASVQVVANIVHSFGKLDEPIKTILDVVNKESEWLIQNAQPQAISNIAWAYATLSTPAPNFFHLVEQHVKYIMKHGNPQNISNIAWAYATLSIPAPLFFHEIEKNATIMIKQWNVQDVSNTVWACSELKYNIPRLLHAVDAYSLVLLKQMSSQNIANVAQGFARIGHRPKYFFNTLEKNIDSVLLILNSQTVCNILWSLAILDLLNEHDKLVDILWDTVCSYNADTLSNEQLNQLAQVVLHAKAETKNENKLCELLPMRIRDRIDTLTCDAVTSRSEDEYSELLSEIGFHHERDVPPTNNSYGNILAIDYACKSKRIAIEFNGASHYLTDLDKKLANYGEENGPTIAKRRLLKRLGWDVVVSIPYMHNIELDRRGGDRAHELKKIYLKKRLALDGDIL